MALDLVKLYSLSEFLDYEKTVKDQRDAYEKQLAIELACKDAIYVNAFCEICNNNSNLLLDWRYSDKVTPNFRERMFCSGCRLNNRQRFMASLIRRIRNENPGLKRSIYFYEQITPIFKYITNSGLFSEVVGSEYLGNGIKPGEIINGIRHEDAMSLSFPDQSFGIISSNDVFEHIPDINKALREASRVLTRHGKLLMSVPFTYQAKTIPRAAIENSQLVHLLPPQFHGNPLDPEKGSLLFYDFGWDILDMCLDAGFKDAYMLGYYSIEYGYIGKGFQSIFIAEK